MQWKHPPMDPSWYLFLPSSIVCMFVLLMNIIEILLIRFWLTINFEYLIIYSSPVHGEALSIQCYVIKFVRDLRQVCGFPPSTPVSSNKTDRHNITEILLKVVLNTINHKPSNYLYLEICSTIFLVTLKYDLNCTFFQTI